VRRAGIYVGETPGYIRPILDHTESQTSNKKLLIVNLFSRWRFKELDVNMGREIINHCLKSGYALLLVGDKSERVRADLLCNKIEGDIDFLFGSSFAELASAIERAFLVISIDSFIVHFASSLTKPVFAIYGPSGEEHWAPWRTAHLCYSERERYSCRPCGQDGCGGSKVSECLRAVNQSKLLRSLDQFVDDIRQYK
jgi:heptosyltransferase-3